MTRWKALDLLYLFFVSMYFSSDLIVCYDLFMYAATCRSLVIASQGKPGVLRTVGTLLSCVWDAVRAPHRCCKGNGRRVLFRHVRLVLSYSRMYCRLRNPIIKVAKPNTLKIYQYTYID